jgi:hypothetical protein
VIKVIRVAIVFVKFFVKKNVELIRLSQSQKRQIKNKVAKQIFANQMVRRNFDFESNLN